MLPPEGWKGGGYLSQLPPGAEALVEQERERMGRLLAAVLVDFGVTLSDTVLVVLGDLGGSMGMALGEVLMEPAEIQAELRAAEETHRRPVVLDVAVKDRATEFIDMLMPEIRDYVAMRPPFAVVLLVLTASDDASITMAVPHVGAIAPGGIN